MERPTCGTCPYLFEEEVGEHTCRRHAPKPSKFDNAEWPIVDHEYDTCGEHPDFPAWIAATRSAPPSPDHTGECARE